MSDYLVSGGRQREASGFIVTVKNADGKTLSLHRTGRGALSRCLDDALILDPTFRVLSISTPESIYNDLQGRASHPRTHEVQLPEPSQLGRIQRMEMLHAELRPRSAAAYRKAQERGETW